MATQLLFYRRLTPISVQRHADWCVEGVGNYDFASHAHAVPLMAVELPQAIREYTIVFLPANESVIPVALLGIAEGHNAYITATGGWEARYVPAFVRRYPFVFSRSDDGTLFTLCIDESWSGCNEEGRGQRLFNAQGERTPYLDHVLSFLQQYHVQNARTEAFCHTLNELGILEPMQAQFTLAGGAARSLGGFLAVNRDKLKALPDDQLAALARSDDLELVHLHLQSMHNLPFLAERAAARGLGMTSPAGQRAEAALATAAATGAGMEAGMVSPVAESV